jgi:hypothetical protein
MERTGGYASETMQKISRRDGKVNNGILLTTQL